MFSRLGKTTIKRPATSTSVDPGDSMEDDEEPGSPLAYAGVLKDIPTKKAKPSSLDLKKVPAITISNNVNKTVIEDTNTEGVLAHGGKVGKKSALSRLGGPVVQAAASSTSAVPAKKSITQVKINKTGM